MKRLGIFVFYDQEGIVDKYVEVLLETMLQELKKLVIVVNGNINESSKQTLLNYSENIFVRENKGYDGGAYKDVFLNYMVDENWENWDEVVLFNDTFFGSLFPWKNVFDKMEPEDLDFWGLTRHPGGGKMPLSTNEIPSHLQGYFLVCKKNLVMSEAFNQFWKSLEYPKSYNEAVENFEIRFTTYFQEAGFRSESYIDVCNYSENIKYKENPYLLKGYELVKDAHFPIVKKKALFAPFFGLSLKLLDYIESDTAYDVDLIKQHLKRLYRENNIFIFKSREVLAFCEKHNRVYIYGHGEYAKNLNEYFEYKGLKHAGYIVTKKEETDTDVYEYADIHLEPQDGVILALGKRACSEVYPVIKERVPREHLLLLYDIEK